MSEEITDKEIESIKRRIADQEISDEEREVLRKFVQRHLEELLLDGMEVR